MSDIFRFKQFSINQLGCAMKVNTDGVLLGAIAKSDKPQTILDIGAGTGVIALMLAQRFTDSFVDAVEIDTIAAHTASQNFADSVFKERLSLYPGSFEQYFTHHPNKKYDLIVSNPPFYINSLESPGAGKTLAKHADRDFFERLVRGVADALTEDGLFWLILPPGTAGMVKNLADVCSLHLHKIINVYSYPGSAPHREVLMFGRNETPIELSKLVIYSEPKHYTQRYQELLRDFLTIF